MGDIGYLCNISTFEALSLSCAYFFFLCHWSTNGLSSFFFFLFLFFGDVQILDFSHLSFRDTKCIFLFSDTSSRPNAYQICNSQLEPIRRLA